MAESIESLERKRREIVQQIGGLGDCRPGSVTAIRKKCGKANCCCLDEQHPGHGPHWRLTYKIDGTTHTESLTGAAIQKAEGEIAEFRRFQELSRQFVEISTAICQLRSVDAAVQQEKKRPKASKGKFFKR